MSKQKFYWVNHDYHNDSLNSLAKRITEFHTGSLYSSDIEIHYTDAAPEGELNTTIGILFLSLGDSSKKDMQDVLRHTVKDVHIINNMMNFNIYFEYNTEDRIKVPEQHVATFDCLVSLAAGEKVKQNPIDIGLTNNNHHVIDISPTAIHKSLGLYRETSSYTQLDIFNTSAVKAFLETCSGTKGFFVVSNCFMYYPTSLLYDVKVRLDIQNKFIETLANDKIDWYVDMISADGEIYECASVKDIRNKQLNEKFKVLPWI